MSNVIVIGGAGYIGSHMVKCLKKHGYTPIVLDDLSSGVEESICGAEMVRGNFGDEPLLENVFERYKPISVMHFASYIQVGESVSEPSKYYNNNVSNTLVLLDAMVRNKVDNFIFSSTAAVFGAPEYNPIDEAHPRNPINPYGRSKLMVENILADYNHAYGLNYGCLRYFNAAGAAEDGSIGECHDPETHLIPLILQTAQGKRDSIYVFGDDYDTKDGSCIRDYIHVDDLSEAHLKLLQYMLRGGKERYFNLGTGEGHSVKEVISAVKSITSHDVRTEIKDRRVGDPAILIADGRRAREILGWEPQCSDLESIIRSAWIWESKKHNSA